MVLIKIPGYDCLACPFRPWKMPGVFPALGYRPLVLLQRPHWLLSPKLLFQLMNHDSPPSTMRCWRNLSSFDTLINSSCSIAKNSSGRSHRKWNFLLRFYDGSWAVVQCENLTCCKADLGGKVASGCSEHTRGHGYPWSGADWGWGWIAMSRPFWTCDHILSVSFTHGTNK